MRTLVLGRLRTVERLVVLLVAASSLFSGSLVLVAPTARAASPLRIDSILSTGDFSYIVMDPLRLRMYVGEYVSGSLLVWNTTGDHLITNISLGGSPLGLTVTPDDAFLYAALTDQSVLAVVNLTTISLVRSIHLSAHPVDVAAGRAGRAYVTTTESLGYPRIVDTIEGREVGNITAAGAIYMDAIDRMSLDQRTLWVLDRNLSPDTVYGFDVRTDNATLIGTSPGNFVGTDVADASLSLDGQRMFVSAATPGGTGYYVEGFYPSNWTYFGEYYTGPYPSTVSVAQRDGTVFASNQSSDVVAFDVKSAGVLGTFTFSQVVYLVRALENGTKIYAITNPSGANRRLEVLATGFVPSSREPPIVAGSASTEWGRAPLAVSFRSLAALGRPPYRFVWSFGDGGSANNASPTHTYTTPGTYSARLQVNDFAGYFGNLTIRIVVAVGLLPNTLVKARGFQGLLYSLTTNNWAPPDPQIAVDRDHVVEVVNSRLSIWNRTTGPAVLDENSSTFFRSPMGEFLSDPKIEYDVTTSRWFASVGDFTSGSVRLLVSNGSDPTGGWSPNVIYVPSGDCPDQPILGVGTSVVVLSVNLFSRCTGPSPSYVGAEYWIINKTDLLRGAAPRLTSEGPFPMEESIHPVQALTSDPTMYLVSVGWALSPIHAVEVISLTGVPPGPVTVRSNSYAIRTVNQPPNVPQPGSGTPINTGDARVLDAFLRGSDMWIAFGDACFPAGTSVNQSCGRILEVNVTQPGVVQDFDIGEPSYGVFYPAIRPDGSGNLLVTFGYASGSFYPGIMAAAQMTTDPLDTYRVPIVLHTGSGAETVLCDTSSCRYGDYFGAAVDPLDPQAVWTCGEFGTYFGWQTFIAQVGVFRTANMTVTFSYTGGGAGAPPPTLAYTELGARYTMPLVPGPTTVTMDLATVWTVSTNVSSSDPLERWSNLDASSGTVGGDSVLSFRFQHQYFVAVAIEPSRGGSVRPAPGWYDAGATINLTAIATAGWKFAGWVGAGPGSYNGSENPHGLAVTGPVMERATFDVGFTISTGLFGSVSYAYGDASGTVPAGATETIFIPSGTIVSLDAAASALFQFIGWSGDLSGTNAVASIQVNQPSAVSAGYGLSVAGLSLVGVLPAAVIMAGLVWLVRRRRRMRPPNRAPPDLPPEMLGRL